MINVAVEGESDREVAKRVVKAAGHAVGTVRVAGGVSRLDPLIPKYNEASRQTPWVVFRDSDFKCPVELRAIFAERINGWRSTFQLRIAHSMSEAWLLADRDGFADYFKVPVNRIPAEPESLPHAKRTLLTLCVNSRSRDIREEVVAGEDKPGPLYVSRINDFAAAHWNIHEAATNSDSLRRAIERIRELPGAGG